MQVMTLSWAREPRLQGEDADFEEVVEPVSHEDRDGNEVLQRAHAQHVLDSFRPLCWARKHSLRALRPCLHQRVLRSRGTAMLDAGSASEVASTAGLTL